MFLCFVSPNFFFVHAHLIGYRTANRPNTAPTAPNESIFAFPIHFIHSCNCYLQTCTVVSQLVVVSCNCARLNFAEKKRIPNFELPSLVPLPIMERSLPPFSVYSECFCSSEWSPNNPLLFVAQSQLLNGPNPIIIVLLHHKLPHNDSSFVRLYSSTSF